MVELVDTAVLGTVGESCAGSSPATYRQGMHSSVGRALDF